MKMMRLMAATALAVGTVTGALVESAEARGGAAKHPGSGNQESIQQVDQTYLLFKEDRQENLIEDSDSSSSGGLFLEAVEDFLNYDPAINASLDFGDLGFRPPLFQSLGFEITETGERRFLDFDGNPPQEGQIDSRFTFANLETTLFEGEEIVNELGVDISDDFVSQFEIDNPNDLQVVRYRILNPEDGSNLLVDLDGNDSSGYLFINSNILRDISNVLIEGEAENVPGGGNFPFPDESEEDLADLATNSLEYIFDQNILGLALGTDTAQNLLGDPNILNGLDNFVSQDDSATIFLLDATFEEVAVPEPGTTTTLLALGALGVGLGLKRKLK